MKNIVIFGCRKVTIDIIGHIRNNYGDRCKISMVVTHDSERDRIYYPVLVSEYCESNGIPWIRFGAEIDADVIRELEPDLILSIYYRRILKKAILDMPSMGAINVHASMLPHGRGPAPSLWNILNGDEFAGSTLHYMTEGVDAGDIINQKQIPINNMTGYELNMKLGGVGAEIFKSSFKDILDGTNPRIEQDQSKAQYCLPFKTSLRYISWADPDSVLNQIRAFAKPFDGALAWTSSECRLSVWEAKILPVRDSLKPPGFFERDGENVVVQTGTLPILITKMDVIDGVLKNKGRFISGPPICF